MKLFGPSSVAAKAKWSADAVSESVDRGRVRVALDVVYVTSDAMEYRAMTVEVSPTGASIMADYRPEIGDHVALYIDKLGFFRGTVVRSMLGGYAVRFFESPFTRIRFKEKLASLVIEDQGETHFEERRNFPRIKPIHRLVTLRQDRTEKVVRVRDISKSGVSFNAQILADIGDVVRIGSRLGLVVRRFENGAAVKFAAQISDKDFDPAMIL